MARADLLINLIRAGVQGDQGQFQKTVEALAAEERTKHHHVLADRLAEQLRLNGRFKQSPTTVGRSNSSQFIVELTPKRRLEDLLLPPDVEAAVRELIEEQHRSELLRSYSLEPRNRLLVAGPPGNGKTSLAEALAESLMVPLLAIRYEAVIGSFLGETAKQLAQVFEFARARHCVLFFDEFDVVGKERGDIHETGEIKRVVSSLLLQADALPSHVVVVAASNHPELLDRAVWRRFQLRLELPQPKLEQVEEWIRRFEKRLDIPLGIAPDDLAHRLKGLSFAEIEEFSLDIMRRHVLGQPGGDLTRIVNERLEQWKHRFTLKPMKQGS